MSTPPPSPGPGLKWVELDVAVEQDIECALAELALNLMREPDLDLRLSAARDWHKVEAKVRMAYERRADQLRADHARREGRMQ
jgi:O-succinylbenzoate synthase